MTSYDEDKKKNKKLTFQDRKNALENSTDQNSDYGSISNEIDSILTGSSQHSNSDTKEKETNNQNKDVNVTIDTPLKKKEQGEHPIVFG